MKVGLVLGAGGVLGGAWLTGGLNAIARETGWDPASADFIVGTSAGSMVGALLAAGVPPWFMVAHSRGETFTGLTGPDGQPASEADRAGGAEFRLHRGLPVLGPGSLRMTVSALKNPLRRPPLQLVAGWVPVGLVSTDALKDTVRRAVPGRWVDHPNYWAVTCDYRTGKRIPFGRTDSPPAEVADAVAASCAIPGFYRPVKIGGRRYVDGGVCSASNLDLLRGRGLDLVICMNPLSSLEDPRSNNPLDWPGQLSRSANGRRLGSEARKVRAYGTNVVLIQPTEEDLDAMGRNLMSPERRDQVIASADRSVSDQIAQAANRAHLDGLPQGEPHKIDRPAGPPSTWPSMTPAVRRAA